MRVKTFFKKPFYYLDTAKSKWIYIASASLFALFFLIIFQPYGISEDIKNPENPEFSEFLFFASITVDAFIGLLVSQFIIRPLAGFQNINNNRYVFYFFVEAFIIWLLAFATSFVIPDLGNDFEKELNVGFQFTNYIRTIMVLIFPFFGVIMYQSIKYLHEEIGELASQLERYQLSFQKEHSTDIFEVFDENNNQILSMSINHFLYAESGNQYVIINFLKEGKPAKEIVRNRLKNIVNTANHLSVFQCHRSYVVNLVNVSHMVRKENKNYLVFKQDDLLRVPVSKSYLVAIKNAITGYD